MRRAVARLNGSAVIALVFAGGCALIAGLEDRALAPGDGGGMPTPTTGNASVGGGSSSGGNGGGGNGGDPTGTGAGPSGGGGTIDPHEVPINGVGNISRGWWHQGAFHLLNPSLKKIYVLDPELPNDLADYDIDPNAMNLAPRSFGKSTDGYYVVNADDDLLVRLTFNGDIAETVPLGANSLWTLVAAGNDVVVGRDSGLTLKWQPGGALTPVMPDIDAGSVITSNGTLTAVIGTNSSSIKLLQGGEVIKDDCGKGNIDSFLRSISVAGTNLATAKVAYIEGATGFANFRLRAVSMNMCMEQEATIGFTPDAPNLKAAGINDTFILASSALNELRLYDAATLAQLGAPVAIVPTFDDAQEVVMGPTHAMVIAQTADPPIMIAFYSEAR